MDEIAGDYQTGRPGSVTKSFRSLIAMRAQICWIAGDREYAPVLRKLTKGIDRVRFLGRIDAGTLDGYYQHARVLIVPSVCFETFGIILIEAFSQGTLGCAISGNRRAWGGGLLFDGPGGVLESMGRVQADPSLRSRLSQSALEGFKMHWIESMVISPELDVAKRAAQARGRTCIVRVLGS